MWARGTLYDDEALNLHVSSIQSLQLTVNLLVSQRDILVSFVYLISSPHLSDLNLKLREQR